MPSTINIPIAPSLSATDLSNHAFTMLFGSNWWNFTERAADTFTGPLIPILAATNMVLMHAVVLWTLYSVVVGSIGTASEGSVGGKKFNAFWWPLRATFGVTMTAPVTAGGLSIFQIAILTMLGWACTFANNIYSQAIDNLAESNFAILTAEAPAQMQINAKEAAQVIFDATFAQNFIAKQQQDLADDMEKNGVEVTFIPWKVETPFVTDMHSTEFISGTSSQNWVLQFRAPSNVNLRKEDFGGFTIPGSIQDPLMTAQRNGIIKMCGIIAPLTQQLVYGNKIDEGWMTTAVNAYNSEVLKVLSNFNSLYPKHDLTTKANAFKAKAAELGWMSAGAWPLIMSSMSKEMEEKIGQKVGVSQVDFGRISALVDDEKYHAFSVAQVRAESTKNNEPDPTKIGTSLRETITKGDPSGVWDSLAAWFSGRIAPEYLLKRLENEDPALVIGHMGHLIVNAGTAIWSAGLSATMVVEGVNEAKKGVVGTAVNVVSGGFSNGVIAGMSAGAKYVLSWLQVGAAGLFTIGLIFAYVVPAMPLFYWVLAMVGFLLLVVEVMVAAPFWAAAHAWSTQDDGFAGEMGKQGYFQLIEILFRPALYILGFLAIFLLMRVAAYTTARIFEAFYYSYQNTEFGMGTGMTSGPISSLMMLLIIGGLFMYLFFFLCSEGYSHLPRKVMKWIGHESASLGISGGADAMRQMVVGGVSRTTRSKRSGMGMPKSNSDAGDGGGGKGGGNDHAPGEVMEGTGGTMTNPDKR